MDSYDATSHRAATQQTNNGVGFFTLEEEETSLNDVVVTLGDVTGNDVRAGTSLSTQYGCAPYDSRIVTNPATDVDPLENRATFDTSQNTTGKLLCSDMSGDSKQ